MGKKEDLFQMLKRVKAAWDNTAAAREAIDEAAEPLKTAAESFDAAMRRFEGDDLMAQDENLRRLQVCVELMYEHCVQLHNRFGAGLDKRKRLQRIEAAFVHYGANFFSEAACRSCARRMQADLDRARRLRDLADPVATLAATLFGLGFVDIKDAAKKLTSLTGLDVMAVQQIFERTRGLRETVDQIEPIIEPLVRQNLAQADALVRFFEAVRRLDTPRAVGGRTLPAGPGPRR